MERRAQGHSQRVLHYVVMFDATPAAALCQCYGSGVVGFAILIAMPAVLLITGALLHRRRITRRHDPLTSDIDATRDSPGAALRADGDHVDRSSANTTRRCASEKRG